MVVLRRSYAYNNYNYVYNYKKYTNADANVVDIPGTLWGSPSLIISASSKFWINL